MPEQQQKHPGGRPTIYTEEMAQEICDRLANGESLTKICRDEHVAAQTTIFNWLDENKQFLKKYVRARKRQAEIYADETVQIPDDLHDDVNRFSEGEGRKIPFDELRSLTDLAKLRVNARQWHASKLRPKKYGDKLQSTVKSEGKLEITDANDVKDKLLEKLSKKQEAVVAAVDAEVAN